MKWQDLSLFASEGRILITVRLNGGMLQCNVYNPSQGRSQEGGPGGPWRLWLRPNPGAASPQERSGGLRPQTPAGADPGGFAARAKLGAPHPDPRWGSAPDPGGFAARAKLGLRPQPPS